MNSLPTREALLERAAHRAANDPWMLAFALQLVCGDGSSLDIDGIAATLQCDRARVLALALCRRPTAHSGRFREDIAAIAAAAGVDAERLTALLREADTLAAFRAASGRQLLAAARDQHPPDADPEPEDE
jgi:hypothetical protein